MMGVAALLSAVWAGPAVSAEPIKPAKLGGETPAALGAPVRPSIAVSPVAVAPVAVPAVAERVDAPTPCKVSSDITRLNHPLTRTAQKITEGRPLKIVAIGSSSTAGAGASSPSASYPNQLAGELSRMFPENGIVVLNRGVNGEEAQQMMARFKTQVVDEKPDLVLWQVGANTLLREQPVEPVKALIRAGIAQLKSSGADVLLIDSQYAPKIIANRDADDMVAFMDVVAKETNVGVFHRYAMMRRWKQDQGLPFKAFLSPDEVHMNDWSYGCFAKVLGAAISDAVMRPTATATVRAVTR
jgi:acyl-CoA thioesterase-1